MKKLFGQSKQDKQEQDKNRHDIQSIKLDELIDLVQVHIKTLKPDTKEFADSVNNLEKLLKLKNIEKEQPVNKDRRERLSPNTVAVVMGNIAGIALILGYEKIGVITSKALGFVMKGRI